MKVHGNKGSASFVYTPDEDSHTLTYGSNPLLFLEDSANGNWWELGYTGSSVDVTTRFLFYTQSGLQSYKHLPDPTMVFLPSSVDDIPSAINSGLMDWYIDDDYGKVLSLPGKGLGSHFDLGNYHKSVWPQAGHSFMVESIIKPDKLADATAELSIFKAGYTTNHNGWDFLISGTLQFRYGDGSATYTHNTQHEVVDQTWQHAAAIWRDDLGTLTMYIDGVQVGNSLDISGTNIDSTDTYAGTAEFLMGEDYAGSMALTKVSHGEFTPRDFSHTLYLRDHEGAGYNFPFTAIKNRQYSFLMDWDSGEHTTPVYLTTGNTELKNYPVRISGLTYSDIDKISFEQIDGTPLHCMEDSNIFYVKIPLLPADSVVQINAKESSIHNKPRSIADVSFFSDWDFLHDNSVKWDSDITDGVTAIPYFSGLTRLSYQWCSSDVISTGYYIVDPNLYSFNYGYRVLVRQAEYQTTTFSGICGICVEPEYDPNFTDCLNFIIDDRSGSSSYGGTAVGGNYLNFEQHANATTQQTNLRNNLNPQEFNTFDVTVDQDGANATIENLYNAGEKLTVDISTKAATHTGIRKTFGLMYANTGPEQLFGGSRDRTLIDYFAVLEYHTGEPSVSLGNRVQSGNNIKLVVNGITYVNE